MKPNINIGGKLATRKVFNGQIEEIIFNRIQAWDGRPGVGGADMYSSTDSIALRQLICQYPLLDARLHLIDVGFQHLLGLGAVLERTLDRCFTREKIPFIQRMKETAFSKPGLWFSFAFSGSSHRHLSTVIIRSAVINVNPSLTLPLKQLN